jgi:indolepyruvate ferredoxin oxidoreductase
LDEVLVIEEKRGVIEPQLKEQFYNRPAASRPRVLGKVDPDGQALMSVVTELSPGEIAKAIMARFGHYIDQPSVAARLAIIESKSQLLKPAATDFNRQPWFCSGCPHNTSTRVPEGSRATAGIGCHFMSVWMDRETHTYTHMGGEGIPWVGQSRFVKTKHIFANLGDGTYNHSGSMAIRMAVASGANITYKILYNDAVAMTGGQPADNGFTVPQIAAQVSAEGVKRVVVVADDPEKYPMGTAWPSGLQVEHRDDLDRVQRDLRDQEGVTVLIYDQTCATEKRRRRKRGLMEDPNKRIFINPLVCEGCGDCGTKSNCVSVTPVETDFGRKRRIDQSSCNKDYSCVKGFCPSFVNVIGGGLKRRTGEAKTADLPAVFEALPEPVLPAADDAYSIMVAGIGGTGVVTIGALLGMAANLEGRNATILDATGLAQKGGPVVSHVRIANARKDLHAVRVSSGNAKLLIACDIVTATQPDVLAKLSSDQSFAIVNTQETMNGYFAMNADMKFPGDPMQEAIRAAAGDNSSHFLAATQIATKLLGDSIAANGFMLGYAYQQGLIPVSAEAIERAMELNGVAIEFNKQAFLWGRRAAHDLAAVERIATPAEKAAPAATPVDDLDSMIASRREFLTAYQNQAYAGRYEALVRKVAAAEQAKLPGSDSLAKAVARYAFKLMAYKDEYEVARLHSSATFRDQLAEQFEGDYKLQFNLAPPLFSKRDPETGHLKKATFGPWMMTVFGILARFKGLRGTAFDIFGKTEERRTERALITDYFATVEMILERLSGDNHSLAVDLASVPERIRGYGHVKERHLAEALRREGELKAAFVSAGDKKAAAE